MGGRVKTGSKFFGQVFVYKILSKSPMYHKSKQHRQYTLVLPVAPIDYQSEAFVSLYSDGMVNRTWSIGF